jgi:hypothetical protein
MIRVLRAILVMPRPGRDTGMWRAVAAGPGEPHHVQSVASRLMLLRGKVACECDCGCGCEISLLEAEAEAVVQR